MKEITVIGAAIVDVVAGPVNQLDFEQSQTMEFIRLGYGGDGLNEAMALRDLGCDVQLVSKLGMDPAGDFVMELMTKAKISTKDIIRSKSLPTAVNIVLVDSRSERSFLTTPISTMRQFDLEDILEKQDGFKEIVSFASLFVSRSLGIREMEILFKTIKQKERILAADMTTPKNNETLEELKPVLRYIDYLLPNRLELERISGCSEPLAGARRCLEAGAGAVVVKLGAKGALVCTKELEAIVPAWPAKSVDSTGAGDCFAAGFLCGLSKDCDLLDAAALGCAAASFNVEKPGSESGIDLEELEKRFDWIKKRIRR